MGASGDMGAEASRGGGVDVEVEIDGVGCAETEVDIGGG
jgi:hypothetical protein